MVNQSFIKSMMDYVDSHHITSFAEFCQYARNHNLIWFEALCYDEPCCQLMYYYIQDQANQPSAVKVPIRKKAQS